MKTPINRAYVHSSIYLFALALLVCCLPLSRYLLSISQFILALNWLAEGGFARKTGELRRKRVVFIFISILLVYTAGMFYSANLDSALTKMKNAVPLAILPVIMMTSAPLSRKNISRLLQLFALAVIVAAVICLSAYLYNPAASTRDFRKISLFIPHIRFALLIIMAIFILLYHAFYMTSPEKLYYKALQIIMAVFLVAFLFILRSFAGLIILFITGTLFAIKASKSSRHKLIRNGLVFFVLALCVAVVFSVVRMDIKNFHAHDVNPSSLEKTTANGNPYEHNLLDKTMENGHAVYLYICEPELKKEWNLRGTIPYDSGDHKGQPVRITLIRYLTSKGLRKDSAAISRLSNEDIRAIENGRANYLFRTRPGLYQRLYETLWEIHIWRATGFVRYHSFGQRIVFLKTAGQVISQHFFTGVGTGDVYDSMLQTVRVNHEAIEKRWKGEPHNQFAFIFMAFGVFGFAWILFSWIYTAYVTQAYNQLLFNLFALSMLISMTILDTIESYDNMVYFAFFFTLFAFCGGIQKKT